MKMLKNKKALSPVVASIILIAVTVAVSIAVAAWMGALSVGFMGTEQLSTTYARFDETTRTNVYLNVTNSGSSSVVLTNAVVNDVSVSINSTSVPGNTKTKEILIDITNLGSWVDGNTYNFRLTSQKGNTFPYTAVAPAP